MSWDRAVLGGYKCLYKIFWRHAPIHVGRPQLWHPHSACPVVPALARKSLSLSGAHHFAASPYNSNQTFQGVVIALFVHSRGEEAGNDPFPSLSVTIHLGWGEQGCVTLARSPPPATHWPTAPRVCAQYRKTCCSPNVLIPAKLTDKLEFWIQSGFGFFFPPVILCCKKWHDTFGSFFLLFPCWKQL